MEKKLLPFIKIFNLAIPMYGLMIIAGTASAVVLAAIICKKNFLDINNFIIVTATTFALGFAGAKLLYIAVTFPPNQYFKQILLLFKNQNAQNSGFIFFGGLILGIPGYYLGCRIAKCKPKDFYGISAFMVPMINGFGRIGCFCAGCCYGIPYSGPLAVIYSNPLSNVTTSQKVFPVQLLEALILISLGTALFIFMLTSKKVFVKKSFISITCFFLFYPIQRFFIEFLRGDLHRGFIMGLSTSQALSILALIITIIILTVTFIKRRAEIWL